MPARKVIDQDVQNLSAAPAKGKRGEKNPSNAGEQKKYNSHPSRRNVPEKTKKTSSWPILFWLGFIILFLGVFLFNRETITDSIRIIKESVSRETIPPPVESTALTPAAPPSSPVNPPAISTEPAESAQGQPETIPSPASRQDPVPDSPPDPAPTPQTASSTPQADQPVQQLPAQPAEQPVIQNVIQTPTEQPSQTQNSSSPAAQTPQAELRDRSLYFIHVDRGGSILREKVNRKIPVSDSPMTDAIEAIISGPNTEEKNKGLISLIPPNTRILSATVRGNTAYISFSEDFQYNTYGVEGYAGQLRQFVFTATEFPNVDDVQILIEGRLVDYLGEGIWIGTPLSRDRL